MSDDSFTLLSISLEFIDYTFSFTSVDVRIPIESFSFCLSFSIYRETVGNFQATCDDDDVKTHVDTAVETAKTSSGNPQAI